MLSEASNRLSIRQLTSTNQNARTTHGKPSTWSLSIGRGNPHKRRQYRKCSRRTCIACTSICQVPWGAKRILGSESLAQSRPCLTFLLRQGRDRLSAACELFYRKLLHSGHALD